MMPRPDSFGPDTIPYEVVDLLRLFAGEYHIIPFGRKAEHDLKAMIAVGSQIAVSLACIDGGTWRHKEA